jgi:iron complex transport system permease protein
MKPFALLGLLVLALFAASLLVGPAAIGLGETLSALLEGSEEGETLVLILWEIRLPRALLGLLIGAGLGLAGAAMQGFLRNPLAEPGLLGTSSAAALGAVIALQTGIAAWHALALPMAALAGAFGAVALVVALAGNRGGTILLILAGIAVSAFAGALASLVLNLSPNPFATSEIVFWMMGSLSDRSMAHVWIALPFLGLGAGALFALGRGLDALTLGEDAAASLGYDLSRMRLLLVLGTASTIGGATAVAGAVGFVGLVVPHLLRPFVGARPSTLLPASALGGAAMLLAADIATRLIAPARDLKLGVLTALIGAPFFLHLLWTMRRRLA